jgi:hypothetical protein
MQVISKAIYGHGTAPEYRWACIQMVMYVITYLLEAINVTKVRCWHAVGC